MSLADIPTNARSRVIAVENSPYTARLADMGVIAGAGVQVLHVASGRGALIAKFGDSLPLAMDISLARLVQVCNE